MALRARLWILVPLLTACRLAASGSEEEEYEEYEEGLASLPQARSRIGGLGRTPTLSSGGRPGVAGLDVPISTSPERSLSENSIAVHPSDPSILLCANNSASLPFNTSRDVHVGWSTDGGRTWTNLLTGPAGRQSFCDPAAAIDRAGRFYVGYKTSNAGQGIAISEDVGATWRHVQVANAPPRTIGTDKGHVAVDVGAASPFEGRLYFAWTAGGDILEGGPSSLFIRCARSLDGGSTWSAPVLVSTTTGHQTGANLRVGPDGEVYCSWSILRGMAGDERAIAFNRSFDGGVTWQTPRQPLVNLRGVHGTGISNAGLRVFSFPSMAVDLSDGPRRGWLYVFWNNFGHPGVNTGDPDVFMWRSPDRGTTWDGPVRVNDDLTSNAQWQVWGTCDDANGDLYAVFYDRREDPLDRDARTYVARSTDGGDTWTNFPVGDAPFVPGGIYGTYMGDYIGIAALDSHVYPLWGGWAASPTAYVSPFQVVVDTLPPVLEVALEPEVLWPPDHRMVPVLVTASVTDDSDPDASFVLSSITCSEPDQGQGSGDLPHDVQDAELGTPDTQFLLRAERTGKGPGRIYAIEYAATDSSGNRATRVLQVRVPHDPRR